MRIALRPKMALLLPAPLALALLLSAAPAHAAPTGNILWSGQVTKAGPVSQIAGSWQVPSLQCAVGEDSGASQWIGLDGINSGLVQVGVASRCAKGLQVNLAFYQIIPQNSVAQYLSPATNTVFNGDFVDAKIVKSSAGAYSVTLSDGWWSFSQDVKYGPTPHTAEWIVESGTHDSGKTADPLSNFKTVHFTGGMLNGNLLTDGDTVPFTAVNASGQPTTSVSNITQFGGAGPAFDVAWLRT
jgi:Peptidase A4 family